MKAKTILKIELVENNGMYKTVTNMIDFGVTLEGIEVKEVTTDDIKGIFQSISHLFDIADAIDKNDKSSK